MKTKSFITIIASLLVSTGFAFAQAADTGRCGQERGTCGNQCTGKGFCNQGPGKGNGNAKGLRGGPRDGTGKGLRDGTGKGLRRGQDGGKGQRRGPRDGSGPGCNKGA